MGNKKHREVSFPVYLFDLRDKLSLDTAGAVAACQLLNFGNSDHVVVAADGVLQSGSSNSELNSSLGVLAGQQSVDQTAAEGVTAANAVDDVQVVLLGEAVVLAVVQHCGPAVVECGVGLTQGDSDLLKAELVSQLLGNGRCSQLRYRTRP